MVQVKLFALFIFIAAAILSAVAQPVPGVKSWVYSVSFYAWLMINSTWYRNASGKPPGGFAGKVQKHISNLKDAFVSKCSMFIFDIFTDIRNLNTEKKRRRHAPARTMRFLSAPLTIWASDLDSQ